MKQRRRSYDINRDLQKALNDARDTLDSYKELLNHLMGICISYPEALFYRKEKNEIPDITKYALFYLLHGITISLSNLATLSEIVDLQTRDCFTIARGIVESSINICYILASGEDKANQAFKHASFKSLRDMRRESRIGESTFKIVFQGIKDEDYNKLLLEFEEFLTKKGKDKNWTDDSIERRIKIIGNKYGKSELQAMNLVYLTIYGTSSEIIHGSIYGTMKYLGQLFDGTLDISDSGIDKRNDHLGDQLYTIFISVIGCLSTLITCFDKEFGFEYIKKASEELHKKFLNNKNYKKYGYPEKREEGK